LKKAVLIAIAIWGVLLLLGGVSVGVAAWQAKGAADLLKSGAVSTSDVYTAARKVAWMHRLLVAANVNPSVQTLRLMPGISWIPETLSVSSRFVTEANSVLQNGGVEILASALSGKLTPSPGAIEVSQSELISSNAQKMKVPFTKLRSAVVAFENVKVPGVSKQRMKDDLLRANDYLDLAESALVAMQNLPQLIGSETSMRYFVGITNEAELRGIQGIIGQYAIIEINNGKISVSRSGSNLDLVHPPTLPAELIGEYSETYGDMNTEWQNMNLSTFLDPAALQITNAWKLQTGESLDGVVLIDTVALAKWALPKVGSVESAQGRVLSTWEDLADYLSNGIYFDFPSIQIAQKNNQTVRKEFQSEIAEKLITAITSTNLEPEKLIRNLAKPMLEGRVVAWLNNDLGSEFNRTILARSSESFPTDVVVGFNNLAGNKMDFYLRAKASDQVECVGSQVWHDVKVDLSSQSEKIEGYPVYVKRRMDLSEDDPQVVGSYLDISVVVPASSTDFEVSINKNQSAYDLYQLSSGRTTIRLQSEVNVGESSSISVRFRSAGRCDAYRIRLAPLRYSGE
jgi:hypothetical protein